MKKTLLAALIAATALVPPALAQDRGGRWGGNRGGGERATSARPSAPSASQPWRTRGQSDGQQRQWSRGPSGGYSDANRQRPQAAAPQAAPAPRQDWRGNRGGEGQVNRGTRGDGQWNRGDRGDGQSRFNGARPTPNGQATPQRFRGDDSRRGEWNRNDGNRQGQQFRGTSNERRGDWNRGNRGWNDNRGVNGNRGGWNNNDRGRWNNGWRNDRRFDWRGYRNTNRSIFRLPRYYAPSGWGYGYRRFGIGFTLNSILYSSQYWINDPFNYRLPEVYGPYRWVRYFNDALLVDVYTGQVVDTIYDIFW